MVKDRVLYRHNSGVDIRLNKEVFHDAGPRHLQRTFTEEIHARYQEPSRPFELPPAHANRVRYTRYRRESMSS
jgi:hypothetical protein